MHAVCVIATGLLSGRISARPDLHELFYMGSIRVLDAGLQISAMQHGRVRSIGPRVRLDPREMLSD